VDAGTYHSLALKSDGTVVAWGNNSLGQLNVPAGLTGVVDIAAGSGHSLALKGDGTVVAWGNNFDGQSNVPAGLTNVVDVDAGDFHSLALKQVPDTTAPTVSSINRANSNPTNTTGNVDWTVTFSEDVTGVDTGDFALANNALGASPEISGVTQGANASVYTVTATTGSASGTLGLDLSDNDSIKDTANNPLGGTGLANGDFDGELYTIDRSAPTVTGAAVKGPEFTDTYTPDTWTNKDVRVRFTCADTGGSNLTAGSGNQEKDFTAQTSGTTPTFDGTCLDNAENTAEASTFGPIKIDKSAPSITDLGATKSPNGAGWYNTDVTNRFKASDSGSGLSAACQTSFPLSAGENIQSKTSSGEGSALKVTSGSCTDVAGNTATGKDSATFKIDKSAPNVTATPSRNADHNGWYNAPFTLSFSATDTGGSANVSCDPNVNYNGPDTNSASRSGSCTDEAGNSASSANFNFKYDATAPTAKAPTHTFTTLSTLATSTAPVKLTWSATDNPGGSGVASYQLQQSVNGGTYSNVTLPSATATTISRSLAPGTNTYRYRVAAKDNAGNLSAWATDPSFKVSAFQESSSAIVDTGSWTTSALSGAYGGSVQYASALGRKATFTVPAGSKNVEWVSYRGQRGKAQVWLDGVQQDANSSVTGIQPFDLYSSSVQARKVIFSKAVSSTTTHKLEVRVLGQKNASSTSTRVDIDAFVTTS
jgi:Regulator of chromosome condensation (RCC1) repeat